MDTLSNRSHNPFQAIDIKVPADFSEECKRFSQTAEAKSVLEQTPFPRQVDFWFLCVCMAVREGLKPKDVSKQKNTVKMIDGSIFSSDPWRVQFLMLIALSLADDVEILTQPRKMMEIANGLAVAGLPKVLRLIKEGDQEPIWNLPDAIDEVLRN